MHTTVAGYDVAGRRHAHLGHHVIPMHVVEVLVIQTPDLVLLLGAQVAPGDPVDDEQQDTTDDETPRGAGRRRSELVAHLDPVVFPPSAGVGGAGHPIQGWNPRCREEAGQDVPDKTTYSVNREDIQSLVNAD